MKTTLRLALSALLLAAAACGRVETTDEYEPADPAAPETEQAPEQEEEVPVEPEATPEPTPTPNAKPFVPLFAIADEVFQPMQVAIIDLTLADPDEDALTSECHAYLTSADPELSLDGQLTKVSESQYTFDTPVTEQTFATVVFRCTATDEHGEISDVGESAPVTIDNTVRPFGDWRNFDAFDICRDNPAICRMQVQLGDVFDVRIPDPTDIPDQISSAAFELPQGHFAASVDVNVDTLDVARSLNQSQLPSIAVTFGANDDGFGYMLEMRAQQFNGVTSWKMELRALTGRALRGETYMEGTVLATANLGKAAPAAIDVAYLADGLHFSVDGVNMATVSGSNLASSRIAFSSRAATSTWSAPVAALKP